LGREKGKDGVSSVVLNIATLPPATAFLKLGVIPTAVNGFNSEAMAM
jgi:hypothetical protein